MKKMAFTSIILLLSLCILNSTCKKNNDNIVCPPPISDENCSILAAPVHDESSSILGKWRLIVVRYIWGNPKCSVYCQYNIVLEFKYNNILTVSGNTEHDDLTYWVEEGDNFYSVELDEYNNRILKVGQYSRIFRYNHNSNELYLNDSHTIFYNIKIK